MGTIVNGLSSIFSAKKTDKSNEDTAKTQAKTAHDVALMQYNQDYLDLLSKNKNINLQLKYQGQLSQQTYQNQLDQEMMENKFKNSEFQSNLTYKYNVMNRKENKDTLDIDNGMIGHLKDQDDRRDLIRNIQNGKIQSNKLFSNDTLAFAKQQISRQSDVVNNSKSINKEVNKQAKNVALVGLANGNIDGSKIDDTTNISSVSSGQLRQQEKDDSLATINTGTTNQFYNKLINKGLKPN